MLGGWELAVVLVIVLLLFGSRLPSVMRSLGMSITEFKKGVRDGEQEDPKISDQQSRPNT